MTVKIKYIGIDARFFSTGSTGIGRYVYELIKNLIPILPSDIRLVVFLNEQYIDNELFTKNKDKIITVLTPFDHYSVNSFLHTSTVYKSFDLDLLHVPHFNLPFFYKGKTVLTIHDMIHHLYPPKRITKRWKYYFYLYIFKKALKKASAVITVSNASKKELVGKYKFLDGNISVTHEGAPQEFIDAKKDDIRSRSTLNKFGLDSQKYILYLGRHAEHKNLETLIESIKSIPKEYKLVICGKCNWETDILRNFVSKLDLKSRVIFTDFISDDDYIDLLDRALCYVQPSFIEGFGLPLLEAMSRGCPLVCSDIPCHREVAKDSSLYFEVNSAQSLADRLNEYVDNHVLREEQIMKGHRRLVDFSWKKMAKETLDVYLKHLSSAL